MTTKIVSLKKLEFILGTPRALLREVSFNADSLYRPFKSIESSKIRKIDNPIGKLKYVQKKIDENVLKKISLPQTMLGGVYKKSVIDNAKYHVGKKSIVHLDLKDCFHQTKDKKIFYLFKKLGFSTNLASLLTRITTYKTHLPQGAPSSTTLANLILLPMHNEMQNISSKFGLTCTFWVDDINISGVNPQKHLEEFIKIVHKYGYSVGRKKIGLMKKHSPQLITGLSVNNGVRVPRKTINNLRHTILDFLESHNNLSSIDGKIQYVNYINKRQGSKVLALKNKRLEKITLTSKKPDRYELRIS